MASIVPNAWKLTSKTVLATEHSAVKKAGKKKTIRGNDSTSPLCPPSIVLDVRVAFAARVANAKLFVSSGEWGVEQHEVPVSNTNHNTFATSSQSLRREQSVLLVHSKCSKFHAVRVSSQCTAEGPQWIGKIFENECPGFVGVPGTWYDAHLQSKQPMKQQNQNSGDAEK